MMSSAAHDTVIVFVPDSLALVSWRTSSGGSSSFFKAVAAFRSLVEELDVDKNDLSFGTTPLSS